MIWRQQVGEQAFVTVDWGFRARQTNTGRWYVQQRSSSRGWSAMRPLKDYASVGEAVRDVDPDGVFDA